MLWRMETRLLVGLQNAKEEETGARDKQYLVDNVLLDMTGQTVIVFSLKLKQLFSSGSKC